MPNLHEFMMRSDVKHLSVSQDGPGRPISRDGDLVRQGTDEIDQPMRALSGAAAVPAVSVVAEEMYAQMSDAAAGLGIGCQDDGSSQASQMDGGASERHLRALRADEDTVYFPSIDSYEVVKNLPSR